MLRDRRTDMASRIARSRAETGRVSRIGGHDFVHWLVNPSRDRSAAYEAAGIRTRRRGDTLLVHCMDEDAAKDIDRAAET
jgi:hypothetical protein